MKKTSQSVAATSVIHVGNGIEYRNQYERASALFIGTCAPDPEDDNSAAYRLLQNIYIQIGEKADEFGYTCVPDMALDMWEQHKGHEKEVKDIRDAIKVIEEIMEILYQWSLNGELFEKGILLPESATMPKKRILAAIRSVGMDVIKGDRLLLVIPDDANSAAGVRNGCAEGMKRLAQIAESGSCYLTQNSAENNSFLLFSRLVFRPDSDWIAEIFDRGMGANGAVMTLCQSLEKMGYQRVDCYADRKVSIDFVKQYGKKVEPLKATWAEKNHAGVSFFYEETRKEPYLIGIRMPMYRTVLEAVQSMKMGVKDFLCGCTKTCDGCRYCVQTDKTGTRPLAAINIDGTMKCPYYPGFGMKWRQLTPELIEQIPEILKQVDQVLG